MRRGLILVLMVGLVLSCFFQIQAATKQVVLKVCVPEHWRIVDPLKTGKREDVVPRRLWFFDIVQNFRKDHPEIKVEVEPVAYDSITSTFINRSRAGDPPDIIMANNGTQYKLAKSGYLYPLDGFKFDWKDFNKDLFERNMKVNNKIYFVPAYTLPHVLYYNQALFNEAGITKVPETLDELVETAKKLTIDRDKDGNPEVWGFGLPSSMVHPPFIFQNFETLVWLFGGETVDKNGRALFDTPAARKALQFYSDNINLHKITPKGSSSWDKEYMGLFRSGQIAMTFRGAEEFPPAVDALGDKVKMAPIPPVKKGGKSACWGELFGWVMSTKAGKDPGKREAAWEFLKSLMSKEAYIGMAKYQRGLSPRISVSKDPIFSQSEDMRFLSDYSIVATRFDEEIIEWDYWADTVARTVQAAVLKLRPIDELLKNAQREYDARIGH
ncbi:MAG: ABC transporter substrate-binding protein [Bacteroidota bacterium]